MKKRVLTVWAILALLLSACIGNSEQPAETFASSSAQGAEASESESTPEESAETSGEANAESDVPALDSGGGTVTSSDDITFPIGGEMGAPAFTGTAYFAPMIANDEVYNFPQTNNIVFEPGARSNWHSHGGMIILVTGGVGYYQEEGQLAQIIREGDVLACAPGVKHWHGATPDSWFSQMVIYDANYTGGGEGDEPEPVTDEEYVALETEEFAGRVVTADNDFMFQRAGEPVTMDTFNGPIYLSSIVEGENVAGAPGLHYVVFELGVINNWHSHAGGQIMIATDGIGYHQIEGQPVEVLYPGDVALCPPGEKHWHGGSADTRFAHIAINTNPEMPGVEWFDRLSEAEYAQLPTEKTENNAHAFGD